MAINTNCGTGNVLNLSENKCITNADCTSANGDITVKTGYCKCKYNSSFPYLNENKS